jgi:mannose-6-phosphate isomerase-like protein (cupin superfamily)
MIADPTLLLKQLPLPASEAWPTGVPFTQAFAHGTMSLELFAPIGVDLQTPHLQDELYVVTAGTATLVRDGHPPLMTKQGSAIFVPAGLSHRFTDISKDFTTWVIFWGPPGGE